MKMQTVKLGAIRAEYIQHCGSDLMVVKAARVSTGREAVQLGERERKLIKFLATNQHFTPFEMCDATFLIECPLFIARQFHRHRTFSYNEWSGRYSVVGENFYIPEVLKMQDTKNKQGSIGELSEADNKKGIELINYECLKAYEIYQRLLDQNVSKEIARMVLPQNMMTKFYAKANLRNWMHYCSLRCDSHAQFEHQHLAGQIFSELLKMFPIAVGALARSMFNEETLERLKIAEKH